MQQYTQQLIKPELKEVLAQARDLISKGWTQHAFARDFEGEKTGTDSEIAACFCMGGAICCIAEIDPTSRLGVDKLDEFAELLGFDNAGDMFIWNDQPTRTISQVLAKFGEALT